MKSDNVYKRIKALTGNQRLLFEEQLRSVNNADQNKKKEEEKAHLIAYIKGLVSKEDIQSHLKNHLPDYMIPSKFVFLDEFPRLPNGKIDYKALEIASNKIPTKTASDPSSISEVEKKLIAIWEEILNHSPLSVDDNFFEIGGDSILSIQIISKARKEGIFLEANQIFEHQTIAELAFNAKANLPVHDTSDTLYTGDVNLSPMQHCFFEHHSIAPNDWNLVYRLKLKNTISSKLIERAVGIIIERHESLRLSFKKKQNSWKAEILNPEDIKAYSHQNIDSFDFENHNKLFELAQSDFSLSDSVLFKIIQFTSESSNNASVLFLSHHLLIDDVSWKIIFDDFESILEQVENEQTINLSPISLPYHKWIETLTNSANSNEICKEIPFWLEQISATTSFSVEFKSEDQIKKSSIETETFILDFENSKKLLNEANSPYNTNVEDLLIFVLAKTLIDWSKLDFSSIGLACQGREWMDKSIDPSDTVGCLKSHFPLKIKLKGSDLSDGIKGVKEQLRQIPYDGLGYSLLRYYHQSEEIKRSLAFKPQVVFNYLGNQLDDKENLRITGQELKNLGSKNDHQFVINSFVSEDKLHIHWNYGSDFITQKTIQELVASFEVNLKSVIQHCINVQNIEYTPSDFPESGLNQNDLNNLLDLFN